MPTDILTTVKFQNVIDEQKIPQYFEQIMLKKKEI
jgi:hypothetical protein